MQPGFTLAPRDPFADAKETLSSWDKCMAKDYCKWPVIVAIILGGLIAFSVVFCIARCICCGADDSGHRRMKSDPGYPPPQPYPQQPYANAPANPYAEARSFAPPPPPPQINTQYQSHATPTFNPQTNPKFAAAAVRPVSPDRPQYATFDARSQPVNEDALPEMPSWNNARSVHVQVEEEAVPEKRGDVEMDRFHYDDSVPNPSTAGVASGAVGAGMRGSPGPGMRGSPGPGMRGSPGPGRSPVSPLPNDAYAHQNQSPYDPHNSPQPISPAYPSHDYARGPSPAQSYSQYSQASDPYDRRSPQPSYPQPYATQPYNTPSDRYNSPAPPSYHTTAANPYAYAPAPAQPYDQPRSYTPGHVNANGGGSGYGGANASGYQNGGGNQYGAVDRSQNSTPSAYPGQQSYQAFQPQVGGGVVRKPVEGSLRDV
ncbi:hypothetical protein EKO04_003908 [Ascochyta lentis]|uniref:Uncharacterized protein n=1 Tax=Ascochyta lentis TaxID=205686 RepID=A0A8H7J625_9PLEO|nr:hypothetical protein EKO04_003908 [Ascochyta lentis]